MKHTLRVCLTVILGSIFILKKYLKKKLKCLAKFMKYFKNIKNHL